jgi:hypothetical protein
VGVDAQHVQSVKLAAVVARAPDSADYGSILSIGDPDGVVLYIRDDQVALFGVGGERDPAGAAEST